MFGPGKNSSECEGNMNDREEILCDKRFGQKSKKCLVFFCCCFLYRIFRIGDLTAKVAEYEGGKAPPMQKKYLHDRARE